LRHLADHLLWFWSDWDPLGAAGSGAALGVFFLPLPLALVGRTTQNGLKAPSWASWRGLMQSIEFDAAGLVKDLDVFAKVQLPFVAARTVNLLASATKVALQREMLDSFERTSPFTFKSLEQIHFATKAEPWTVVQHKTVGGKGNAAANYLLPQITGGMVYRTRFQNRLSSELDGYNGRYMLPLEKSEGAKLNAMGRMQASQYVEALYGVKAMESVRASMRPGKYRTEGSYVYVPYVGANKPLAAQMRAIGRGKLLSPGIYRMMGSTPIQVFKQLERVPTVQKRYDFAYAAQLAVKQNVKQIFDNVFLQAVGRANL